MDDTTNQEHGLSAMNIDCKTKPGSSPRTDYFWKNMVLTLFLPFVGDTDRGEPLPPVRDPASPKRIETLTLGETICQIALENNVRESLLLAENQITPIDATRLPVGCEINIPYFTGRKPAEFALNGLKFHDANDRVEIARSITWMRSDRSKIREGLALGFQHLSLEERYALVNLIVEGIDGLINENKGDQRAPELRSYCNALRKVREYDISNPFRLSPYALERVVEDRGALASQGRPRGDERVVVIFVARGDWNGAFCSVDLAVTDAARKGLQVQLFEVDTFERIVEAQRRYMAHYRRGPDFMMLFAHGHFDLQGEIGHARLAPQTYFAPKNLKQFEDYSLWTDRDDRIRQMVRFVAPGGSIIFVSCNAGGGSINKVHKNMVGRFAEVAKNERWPVGVIGPDGTTNLTRISFPTQIGEELEVQFGATRSFNISTGQLR